MSSWKQQEIPSLGNDDGQFRLAKCCSMLPTNRAIMQEYQSSGIILCVHNNGSIQIINCRGPANDKKRMQGGQAERPPPCMSLNCHKINLRVVPKTFNISSATCPTGAHEKAAWKARRSSENVCVCGLNALPRWDFKTKVPALLSSISHLHHPPPPLISSQSTQWHQNNMKMAF